MAGDGGDAFPGAVAVSPAGGVYHGFSGMSLRDYFAAKAMQALICSTDQQSIGISYEYYRERTSLSAYEYADAMLKAREVQP